MTSSVVAVENVLRCTKVISGRGHLTDYFLLVIQISVASSKTVPYWKMVVRLMVSECVSQGRVICELRGMISGVLNVGLVKS